MISRVSQWQSKVNKAIRRIQHQYEVTPQQVNNGFLSMTYIVPDTPHSLVSHLYELCHQMLAQQVQAPQVHSIFLVIQLQNLLKVRIQMSHNM